MRIDPETGKIGFAFVNGPLYFSMGGNTGDYYDDYDEEDYKNVCFDHEVIHC